MAKKFYAVKAGRKTGIFTSWDDCKAQVEGYPNCAYKGFATKEEALSFLGMELLSENKVENEVIAYVDGSYNVANGEYSYGMVILRDGKEMTFSQKYADEEMAAMRNVAGEIKGAEAAMRYAIKEELDSITIVHDYEGIAKWCLGEWKTNKEGTRAYKAFYDEVAKSVKIHFVKVKGHSNDKYNDYADKLAKEALSLIG